MLLGPTALLVPSRRALGVTLGFASGVLLATITFEMLNMPVSPVGHWVKISRQLAADNAALAAYINLRMTYGVNLRVENQLINGNGTSPNVSGMMKSGNYTAHGYSASALGAGATRLDLIRKVIADCMLADYPASAVILNPADWATVEIDIFAEPVVNSWAWVT